ncbi:MAG: hypothetical protein ACOC6L_04675 [Thermodesulfobacteriota bacterium]
MENSSTNISELSQLCQKVPQESPEQLIAESDLVWISGTPAPAEKGSIALNLLEGIVVTMLEKDVVKAERHGEGEIFRVAVNRESKLIVTRTDVRAAQDLFLPRPTPAIRTLARRFPYFPTLGGCMGACNQLEDECLIGIGKLVEDALLSGDPAALQAARREMARCRDLWFDCAASCFDLAFPVIARR